eukprot:3914585-Pyramimonas_sp.AAC.1
MLRAKEEAARACEALELITNHVLARDYGEIRSAERPSDRRKWSDWLIRRTKQGSSRPYGRGMECGGWRGVRTTHTHTHTPCDWSSTGVYARSPPVIGHLAAAEARTAPCSRPSIGLRLPICPLERRSW